MKEISDSLGIRLNLDPGTRKPFSRPLSKQRITVCWLTLQIWATSPVVKTPLFRPCTIFQPFLSTPCFLATNHLVYIPHISYTIHTEGRRVNEKVMGRLG